MKVRNMKSLRWLGALIVLAVGVAVAAVTGSVPPFSDRPHVIPPPPGEEPRPLSETNPAAAADQAKPIFTGPLGEFLVTPRVAADFPPCPGPRRRTESYKSHELYSPIFGEGLEVYECANGIIPYIMRDYAGPGKRYFVGPAKVPYEAPFDRLVLLTIGGHPAIAQLSVPGDPGGLRIAAIERFPSTHLPGILVVIDNTSLGLEEAAAAVARILGVRP